VETVANKVTDLEGFALEQIFRPYQGMAGLPAKRLDKLPMGIDDIVGFAKENPVWWGLVRDRIKRIGFAFPKYVKHELVDFIYADNQYNPSVDKDGSKCRSCERYEGLYKLKDNFTKFKPPQFDIPDINNKITQDNIKNINNW
jgi:hypothetical protein